MPKRRVKLLECPNCHTRLPDSENFCPNCGQENHEIIRPASHLFQELLGNLFNIDSRFFHTIKALFLSPGKLTIEYNAGKRMYYLPPIRIYLLASVLFFLSQSFSMRMSDQQIQNIKKEISQKPTDSIDINLINQSFKVTNTEMMEFSTYSDAKLDSVMIDRNIEPSFFNRIAMRQGSKAIGGNINGLAETFQRYLSFAMFLFMPLMGLLLLLFYRKQRKFYVEHLIFSVHFHAIAFFIMSSFGLLGFLSNFIVPYLVGILQISIIVYFLLFLKNVYQESWGKTISKLLGLLVVYGLFVGIGVTGIALLSLIFF